MLCAVISGGLSKANGVDKVYIGRGTPFGNPFKIGVDGNRQQVIAKFEHYFANNLTLQMLVRKELHGKILVCHCKPLACHGDVYIDFLYSKQNNLI